MTHDLVRIWSMHPETYTIVTQELARTMRAEDSVLPIPYPIDDGTYVVIEDEAMIVTERRDAMNDNIVIRGVFGDAVWHIKGATVQYTVPARKETNE